MKRVLSIMLVMALILAGCATPESNSRIKADNITIFYGFSSYAMFGADRGVIDDLLNRFNSLSFEKTTDEMDIGSAFHVNFSCNGNDAKSFWFDKNGVFRLNGKTQCYKVSSGSFDYEYVKAIYEDSKHQNQNSIDIALQKEIL